VSRWLITDGRGRTMDEVEADRVVTAGPGGRGRQFLDADGNVVFEVTEFALPRVRITRMPATAEPGASTPDVFLAAFLTARWDEVVADAQAVGAHHFEATDYLWNTKFLTLVREDGSQVQTTLEMPPGAANHIVRNDPAAVLADIASKRALLADYLIVVSNNAIDIAGPRNEHSLVKVAAGELVIKTLRMALLHLATPFNAHPDYKPERWLNA
jgi:Family of unknown function (DUF6221)